MKNKNLSMIALTAVLAALSITLAGCAGPAKEAASSAAESQAAGSAAAQTEETGGETESLPPEESAVPQEEAGQAAPRTEAAPDASASAKSSASSAGRAPERQPEASASRSSSTTAASRPAAGPSRTQSPAAKPTAPASTTRRPTTASTAKTTRSTAAPTKPPADGSLSGYADAVAKLVNQERAKAGLKSLSVNQAAAAAANVRAREIEGAFSHTRPNGSSFSTALKEQGAAYRAAGENIAYGQRSAEQVMEGWMNSSGHRANILNAQYTAIGVGVYRGASRTLHWVQLFIG